MLSFDCQRGRCKGDQITELQKLLLLLIRRQKEILTAVKRRREQLESVLSEAENIITMGTDPLAV